MVEGRSCRGRAALGAGAWILLGAAIASARAELQVLTATEAAGSMAIELERAVARVDRTVITLSELLAEARLTLLRRGGVYAAERLELDSEGLEAVLAALDGRPANGDARDLAGFLSSVLTSMVHRSLLLTESRRLQLRELSESAVEDAYRELLDAVGDRLELRDALESAGFGVTEDPNGVAPPAALAAVLRAERTVERLVDLRARSRAPIRKDELRACYLERAEELGRPGFEAVRRGLETAMRLARVTTRLAELITQLEERIEVRFAAPFRPELVEVPPACPPAEAIQR